MPRGAEQLRLLARDLRVAGSPGRGLRSNLRRNVRATMEPARRAVQQAARSLPAAGPESTGLREALARATRIQFATTGANFGCRLITDGRRMPAGQQSLPTLMEGLRVWRHPVLGHDDVWVSQQAHPYFNRTIEPYLAGVSAGVLSAVDQTAAQLTRGGL